MMNVLNWGLHFKCAALEHGRGISDVRLLTSSVGTSRSHLKDLLRLINYSQCGSYIARFTQLAGGSGMDLHLFGTFYTI